MSGPQKPAIGDKPAPAKPCPICRKPSVERYRPFCSKRCADVDLNRWLSGSYAIPGRPEDDEDGEGQDGER
ncbi:DNA gyrase inhibitor YacG [Xanthobacter dioxanivorans]|uniref:DNA gyrase inhibitor YacG n=1 Tax=Xanthobacter dioxanivorans TaxID=2528964 RepID=A0A974PJ29_9HYPH|nr:DNA gyrase inhibitor YacG [Xanthobacter dioxanivorans]QRG04484.1 DNA gyrase inhibitor YacG [Xanthobacter dioxanivorans]